MIRYALVCGDGHEFEAWFRNSEDYDRQAESGLVECPWCASRTVTKQVMAPAVSTGERRERMIKPAAGDGPPDFDSVARKVQAHIRANFDYVGDRFAERARAMHRGDAPDRPIYGETTAEESAALREEGVPCAPLPAAFAPTPPKKAN